MLYDNFLKNECFHFSSFVGSKMDQTKTFSMRPVQHSRWIGGHEIAEWMKKKNSRISGTDPLFLPMSWYLFAILIFFLLYQNEIDSNFQIHPHETKGKSLTHQKLLISGMLCKN